jgi:hypothetical protein
MGVTEDETHDIADEDVANRRCVIREHNVSSLHVRKSTSQIFSDLFYDSD